MGVNSVLLNSLGTLWPNNVESDDSEDDDMLPTEEYWALPDDGWTLVEKPHAKSRGVKFKTGTSYDALDSRVIEERNYYDALDDIVDDSVLLNYQRKEIRNTNTLVEVSSTSEVVSMDVTPPMYVQPDRLVRGPRNDVTPIVSDQPDRVIGLPIVNTDGVNEGQENMEQTLYNRESVSVTVMEKAVELLPVRSMVVQRIRAEEVIIEGSPAGQGLKNETTKPTVSTELVNLSQEWLTSGFLELAEEAMLVDVGSTPSGCMEEIVPQRSQIGEPMSRDISWRIEEIVDQSVDFGLMEAMRMPTSVFDEDRSLQWPNEECAGRMNCEYTRESQIFSLGPVWRDAELVFVAAESEVFTPVFTGESVVETVPLVVAEAVTPRVSALPTVGSDFQTGLSTAVGREDRCSLSLGSILDKVDHVAGQLRVRTVPVEDLLFFSAVYFVMPHVLRSLTVRTSTFFLSDGRGELPLPINVRDDRPVRIRRLYAQEMDMRAQMTKEIHGVGPNGDRWDGIDVSDEWYMGRGWVKPQPGDRARVLQGNTFPEISGLESGPAVRTGPFVLDVDWRNGHPNRGDWLLVTIKGALIPDGPFGHLPALWQYTWVCYYIFSFLAARLEMSSASFLKSISESDYDRLYDLPAGIPDVMGLQALRPSAAVCKVMSIPDSNCVRVITPDEHVPTGFHEILIEDMGLREWPKVTLSEIGCLRLDWPQEFFTFVGRYQLELEQMRKECRDRFEGISSGACPTCEKFIQNNLGRHVAMYHLDLAQLWRCPVGWCPVWKGTSQDCIDHMRRAHNTPITMKAGNLARWFPPWTVTREQWHNMSRPSVSGIAIDTFLFSRIGISLLHRYRVFDRFGSHPAFRRPYMTNVFLFLKESDSEAIRRSHRRRARELAAGMSQPASVTRKVMSKTIQSGPGTTEDCGFEYDGTNGGHIISNASRRGVWDVREFSKWAFERRGHGAGSDGFIIAPVHQT